MRDCPTSVSRVREAKKVHPNGRDGCAPKMNHFYVLQAKAIQVKMLISYSCDVVLLIGGVR